MIPGEVREGLFLYTHTLSPYDGGVFYQVREAIIELTGKPLVHGK